MRSDRVSRLLTLGVAAGVVVYVVALLAQLSDLMWATGWNPDAVIVWVLAPDLGPPPRDVIEGYFGMYPITWFVWLTEWLPGHRLLWQLQQPAIALATGALIAGTVWRLAGRGPGLLAAALLLCASPPVLATGLRPTIHGPAFFAAALLAAYVVELGRPAPFGGRRAALVGASAVVAVVAGVTLPDALLWVVGLVPFAAAALALRSRRALVAAAGVLAGAVVVRTIAVAAMESAGIHWVSPTTTALTLDVSTVIANAESMASVVFALGNGAFELSTAGPLRGGLALVCAAVAVAGIATPPALLALALLRRHGRAPSPRLAHLVFWTVVVAGLVAAGLFTHVIADLGSARYFVPLALAAAATAPLLLERRALARRAVLAAALAFVAGSALAMADRDLSRHADDARAVLERIERHAEASGATTGFGEYYVANNVTWHTDGRVVSRPVEGVEGLGACPHMLARSRAWYRPTGARRTFLLWLTGVPVPEQLGRPIATHDLGSDGERAFTMYVFEGDIARRLCRPLPGR